MAAAKEAEAGSSHSMEDFSNADIEVLFEKNGPTAAKRPKASREKISCPPNFARLRSETYKLFKWEDNKWKCLLCGRKFTHCQSGGSASCKKHLDTHQKIIDEAGGILALAETLEENKSQRAALSIHVTKTPRPQPKIAQPITADGYKDHLVNLIVGASLPCYIVKSSAFNAYGRYISSDNPLCENPSPTTLAKWIDEAFQTTQNKLAHILKVNPGKISFILDCWTSSNQKPFQGVIACWINEAWKLCHTPIDLTVLEGSHTGKNLAESFSKVLDQYELWKKVLAITSDNASNMDTFFREFQKRAKNNLVDFDSTNFRVRCMAHIINLSCQDVVKSVVGTESINSANTDSESSDDEEELSVEQDSLGGNISFLDKLRNATRKIRASPQRREYFRNQCEVFGLQPKELLTDCETRWNSTLVMLKRLIELKEPFLSTCQFVKNLQKLRLAEDEELWTRTETMITLLEPFEKATLKLSQAHSPSLSDVSSVFQYLLAHLETYVDSTDKKLQRTRSRSSPNYPEWIVMAAEVGWNKLVKYYEYCDNTVNIVSTVMDPRYKLKWFQSSWTAEYYTAAKQKTFGIWNKYNKSTASSSSGQATGFTNNDEISAIVQEKLKSHYKPDDELKRYLQEPLLPMSMGVQSALEWWRMHAVSYPNLSKMAMDFLAVSATGVPVERLFSSGPDVCKPKQQSMKAESLRKRVILKEWLKCSEDLTFTMDILNDAAKVMIEGNGETEDEIPVRQ